MKNYRVNYYWEGNLYQDTFQGTSLTNVKMKLAKLDVDYVKVWEIK